MKFRIGERVRKRPDLNITYKVVAHRDHEPRWQIQRGKDVKGREWVLTEDLDSLERA